MSSPLIELRMLQYSAGRKAILDEASLRLAPGETLGLIGRTGAGKTTLLRCLLGLSFPQAGEALLFGAPAGELSRRNKARLGYVPQTPGLPESHTLRTLFEWTESWQPGWDLRRGTELIERFELDPAQRVSSLSVGQKQLAALIMAIGHTPELLVLDEPVASLDPVTRRNVASVLAELQAEHGTSIVFSTHILSELERLATHVAVIEHGKVGLHCETDDIRLSLRRWQLISGEGQTLGHALPGSIEIPGLLRYRRIDPRHASLLVDTRAGADIHRLPGQASEHTLNLEDFVVEYLQ